jgi:acyl-CoA synthetase (NDP forming)
MINRQLLNPASIVVVGGSDDIAKPGGKVLKNIIDGGFDGDLYVVNPKMDRIQGITSYRDIHGLPPVDLAVLAVPAKLCPDAVRVLTGGKETRAFIILSAGFSEESGEGERMEEEIVDLIDSVEGCLIGPNCIGVINTSYHAVFTTPIPRLDPKGCDFISGSGATAVFIMESGIPNGLTFSSVYSVGNSAQLGVEEVLQYLDETHDPEKCSPVKLLYIETIDKPEMLLKHARSLIRKGCRIAAIKSGSSEAGSRAATSHTGALASSDLAVDVLFRKAGIVRCYSRQELAAVASVFMHKELPGKNLALISNAGGPCVMLTDAEKLLEKLHPGSSVSNPIDFLATGTAEQLAEIMDACETKFDHIDAMIVIFGSPGLIPIHAVFDVLEEKMKSCIKPIFPVLPSVINAKDEIARFLARGRINFPDEVALVKSIGDRMHRLTGCPFFRRSIPNSRSNWISRGYEGYRTRAQVGCRGCHAGLEE